MSGWGPSKQLGPGSAAAGTWPKIASGTVLTTPEAGAIEYDGVVGYFSPAAGERGLLDAEYVACLSSNYVASTATGLQKLLNSSTNGALTLAVGTYMFDCLISMGLMSTTSGNMLFDVLGAGTATIGTVLYMCDGADGVIDAGVANVAYVSSGKATSSPMMSANTTAELQVRIEGTFRLTVAGTVIPSFNLANTAQAGFFVRAGTYFRCRRVGAAAFTTVGPWS